ncbi:MAG: MBOAT family O-acyltransferase [Clostridium sp.]
MVFSNLLFLTIFLPLTIILYYIAPKGLRNSVLFFVSLIFYAWGEPIYVVIMLFSTLVDYTHGLLVEKFKDTPKKAKLVVISSMIINLSLLGFFKYTDFFINNMNLLFGSNIPLLNLALPIGISFYTFQTMSYTIDVYRGDAKAQRNIISFGAYVSLFPQLIAGPIVRYKTIADQLDSRHETIDGFAEGIDRFIMGLGKKVLLANSIGLLWNEISIKSYGELTVVAAWLGIIAFTFQIYFDFSGYSDMAIGLGKMFGFTFLENFNYPYVSRSITEFWRRWHISLGTWFREYVYIPLGGNRGGKFKFYRNIIIVWFLTGFWHGSNWNFIFWGLYFGVILIIEKRFLLKYLENGSRVICHIYTMFLVIIGWVLFSFDNLVNLKKYLMAMFGIGDIGFINSEAVYYLYTNGILFIVLIIASTPFIKNISKKIKEENIKLYCVLKNIIMVVIIFVSVAYLVDATYNPFLYFRF